MITIIARHPDGRIIAAKADSDINSRRALRHGMVRSQIAANDITCILGGVCLATRALNQMGERRIEAKYDAWHLMLER